MWAYYCNSGFPSTGSTPSQWPKALQVKSLHGPTLDQYNGNWKLINYYYCIVVVRYLTVYKFNEQQFVIIQANNILYKIRIKNVFTQTDKKKLDLRRTSNTGQLFCIFFTVRFILEIFA